MSIDSWLSMLSAELRREGLPEAQIDAVIGDTRAHLRDSGEDPYVTFGSPQRYASMRPYGRPVSSDQACIDRRSSSASR